MECSHSSPICAQVQSSNSIARNESAERFAENDFEAAKADTRPFVQDADELGLWSREFFCRSFAYIDHCKVENRIKTPNISLDWYYQGAGNQ